MYSSLSMTHLISVQIAFHGMDLRIQFSNHLGYKGLIALAVAPSEANTRLTFYTPYCALYILSGGKFRPISIE